METEVQPAPSDGAGNDDVRADVLAAFAQHNAPTETDMRLPETQEQAAASEAEPAPSQERARNERGQFIKADGTVDEAAEAAKTVPDADPAKDTPEQPSKAIETPTSWSAEAKAEWSKLSPAVQAAVLKRETEINEGGRRWSEEKRTYDEMLSPVREQAKRAGVDEREGLNRLLAANAYLERDPENAIQWLAKAYGVDLSKPNGNAQPQPPADPRITELHQTVSQLQQSLQSRDIAESRTAIQQFAASPGHEHFEAVKVKMGQLIQAGLATSLQDAYDQAVWANPETRQALTAAQTAAATKAAADRAQAEKAKRGALSATGSPSASGPVAAKQDYDTPLDAARAAWIQHTGA